MIRGRIECSRREWRVGGAWTRPVNCACIASACWVADGWGSRWRVSPKPIGSVSLLENDDKRAVGSWSNLEKQQDMYNFCIYTVPDFFSVRTLCRYVAELRLDIDLRPDAVPRGQPCVCVGQNKIFIYLFIYLFERLKEGAPLLRERDNNRYGVYWSECGPSFLLSGRHFATPVETIGPKQKKKRTNMRRTQLATTHLFFFFSPSSFPFFFGWSGEWKRTHWRRGFHLYRDGRTGKNFRRNAVLPLVRRERPVLFYDPFCSPSWRGISVRGRWPRSYLAKLPGREGKKRDRAVSARTAHHKPQKKEKKSPRLWERERESLIWWSVLRSAHLRTATLLSARLVVTSTTGKVLWRPGTWEKLHGIFVFFFVQ